MQILQPNTFKKWGSAQLFSLVILKWKSTGAAKYTHAPENTTGPAEQPGLRVAQRHSDLRTFLCEPELRLSSLGARRAGRV